MGWGSGIWRNLGRTSKIWKAFSIFHHTLPPPWAFHFWGIFQKWGKSPIPTLVLVLICNFHLVPWIDIIAQECDLTWIGGEPIAAPSNSNNWRWNMNTYLKTLTYTNWGNQQPNNIPGTDLKLSLGSSDGEWYDNPAESANKCFVCEYEIQ